MGNKLKITLSSSDNYYTGTKSENPNLIHKGQRVDFVNIYGNYTKSTTSPVQVADYKTESDDSNAIALIDYIKDGNVVSESKYGYASLTQSASQTIDLFKREVSTTMIDGVETVDRNLTPLKSVGTDIQNYTFTDYNISNDRTYQYVFYPVVSDNKIIRVEQIVHIKWESWSITELHPVDTSGKVFYAEPNDVWLFNLNVDTGEQSQNITRNEQQTLGVYPRYSQGRQNYITGTVNCLLGSEVVPVTYLNRKGITVAEGGYQEKRIYNTNPTSNEKIDMLNAWRSLVFSSNPKLLKDRKGQAFLVTLTQSTNKPYDNIRNQPDTISFSWTQIGTLEGVSILDQKK